MTKIKCILADELILKSFNYSENKIKFWRNFENDGKLTLNLYDDHTDIYFSNKIHYPGMPKARKSINILNFVVKYNSGKSINRILNLVDGIVGVAE